jgi:hypothetical protein
MRYDTIYQETPMHKPRFSLIFEECDQHNKRQRANHRHKKMYLYIM